MVIGSLTITTLAYLSMETVCIFRLWRREAISMFLFIEADYQQ